MYNTMDKSKSSESSINPVFSVRIVVCDHYLTRPIPGFDLVYSEFRGANIKQVPILRIFGSSPDGHKTCLHIHGVFPYFYVPCPVPNPEPQFLYQMAASLDKALNIALKQASSGNQHVCKISLVKGLPFYGFHDKTHLYLKVFLYNPGLVKKAVELCSNGAILGQALQPHESHLNFTLQFFIDFNLFGMSNIDLQNVTFRKKVESIPNSDDVLSSQENSSLKSESMCYYEADCSATHIINRKRIGKGDGIENPGLEEVWNQEMQRRVQLNMSMASKSLSQGRFNQQETESHYKYEDRFLQKMANEQDMKTESLNDLRSSNEEVYYPAESGEGSQLFNAVDVSLLLTATPGASLDGTLRRDSKEGLSGENDSIVVDETIALNSSFSLHYSQIKLDSEDLGLLDDLKDMDENAIEEDSIMATPAEDIEDNLVEAEYSQIFDEDSVSNLLVSSDDVADKTLTEWDNTFWDGANISQLDGTCDDEHIKKVKKRKARPLQLGLSRPKKKTEVESIIQKVNCSVNDIADKISSNFVKHGGKTKKIKTERSSQATASNENFSCTVSSSNSTIRAENLELYTLRNKFSPKPGPSKENFATDISPNKILCGINDDDLDEINCSFDEQDIKPKKIKIAKSSPAEFIIASNEHFSSLEQSKNCKTKAVQQQNLESCAAQNKFSPKPDPSISTYKYNCDSNDYDVPDKINSTLDKQDIKTNKIKIEMNSQVNADILSNKMLGSKVAAPNRTTSAENVELHGLQNKFSPKPGSSKEASTTNISMNKLVCDINDKTLEYSSDSSEGSNLGFVSFYNKSKLFDFTLDDSIMNCDDDRNNLEVGPQPQPNIKIECDSQYLSSDEIKLHYSAISPRETTVNCVNLKSSCFSKVLLTPKFRPPTKSDVVSSLRKYNIPSKINPKPYFSNPKDVGDKVEIGSMIIKIQGDTVSDQKSYEKVLDTNSIEEWRQLTFLQHNEVSEDNSSPENLISLLAGNKHYILEPLQKPPTKKDVVRWYNEKRNITNVDKNEKSVRIDAEIVNIDDLDNSQAIGLQELNHTLSLETDDKESTSINQSFQVTMQPDGSFLCFGSNTTEIQGPDTPLVDVNFLTVMVLEVHTSVRKDFVPNPLIDQIQAIFIQVTNDCPSEHHLLKSHTEVFVVDDMDPPNTFDRSVFNVDIKYVKNEMEILEKLIEVIQIHDPDIMCGYEIDLISWGYVLERAQILGLEIITEISRITEKNRQKRWKNDENDFEGRIIGRVMFNVWRLFRHELALSSYSFENCMYEILKERVPKYSYYQLDQWWRDESRILRWVPVEHYLTRLSGTVRMMEKLDIINRTSELARLFGLQWWEVISRGSQFRVESLMLRAARPLNLVALSPTVRQRAAMRAPECLPLIFEPESRFYSDPVIVLDFQSLYPSMMIAYNYCFSTCIGRVQNITGDLPYEFGAWRLRISKSKLEALVKNGLVHWSPVGVGFVKSSVRRGVLPSLLRRILAARQAVKKSMKQQTDESVKKAMHSRQLGLKLIANVTYGYTAANFSGRMPCVEVGDSVVSKGRETLERAIKLVENNQQWNAKVVYGDTDSMFVLVPGGSRAQAFAIGQEIADAVTADNPSPVALKLEKVYQPCILQTKKRYVGYMYESADQEKPVYEAKGIETVRRDGCPAGVKLLQSSLCELFETGDMSRVKQLVTSLLTKLVDGSLPHHQLFFTREYNGPNGYRPGAAAPPNEIAKRLGSRDPRAPPRAGQRVSWLVCAGAPGLPLVKLARSPAELRRDPALRPHVAYYATRVLLPPLNRCLALLGVNVFHWWTELGFVREIQASALQAAGGGGGGGGIARYLCCERCALCGARGGRAVCGRCSAGGANTVVALAHKLASATALCHYAHELCRSCCGHQEPGLCENTECPLLWRKQTAQQKLTQIQDVIRQAPGEIKQLELHF